VASLSEVRAGIGLMLSQVSGGSKIFLAHQQANPVNTGNASAFVLSGRAQGCLSGQVFGNPGSSGSAVYRFSPERSRYEVQIGGGLVELGCMPVSGRTSCITTC